MERVQDLGRIEYQKAWDLQINLLKTFLERKAKNQETFDLERIFFCEHNHVYTLGKSGSIDNLLINEQNLKEKKIEFFKTDRGGDITYHGPGQIVGYPILDLKNKRYRLREYIFLLEESIIQFLKQYSIEAFRIEKATGVWVKDGREEAKICAIGVRCSKWITMHGFAFNITTNLDYFNYINPCGFTDKKATSLEKLLKVPPDIEKIKQELTKILIENLFKEKKLN